MKKHLISLALLLVLVTSQATAAIPDGVTNSQKPGENPPSPAESLKKITLPDGFRVSLFAAEPNVAQPIAMAIDDRGRLWVAECYSYKKWQPTGLDRILIFEDTDGDGRFDKRKVFAEGLANLSGIELGFGGVWVCCAPKLLFIPDRNRDDKPDGPPVTKLDGWDTTKVGHNIINGLTWGPDGWLYGMQGIQGPSRVGKPGTPAEKRVDINCGVWRYHPTREKFEVVAHGTTNPWGLDFDARGEAFFTNCVIGHLWHLIPGARYKRMYGEDFNPHSYGLIGACSDHLHWGGGKWNEARGGQGKHSLAGGGHAHVGAMIYLGDNWPDKYRGTMFTFNIHGYRLNNDRLERHGSGYVGKHGRDMFFANDPWFRGLELKYGPDGGVFIIDWCDYGECHDNDGVHRTSGRIYKVMYGAKKAAKKPFDLQKLDDAELVKLLAHKNQWYVRHARRILQERAAAGRRMDAAYAAIVSLASDAPLDGEMFLQLLWALHAIGRAGESQLQSLLAAEDEHVRVWAVRLLCDRGPLSKEVLMQFAGMAHNDKSQLVRLYLASALQRIPLEARWPIAEGLLTHAEDAKDHNLPLMIWYGIEPLVPLDKKHAIALAAKSKIPLVRQYIARRAAAK